MSTVDFDTLAAYVKTRKVGAVAAWCARNRVLTFRDTKGRPCTTLEALNRALYRGKYNDNEPNYEWENSPADSRFPVSLNATDATTKSSATNGSNSPGSMKESKRFTARSLSSIPVGQGRLGK